MKKILSTIVLLFLVTQFTYSNSRKLYLVLNMNSCANCLMVSKSLQSETKLLSSLHFLFSENEITQAQAETFASELFVTIPKLEFNHSLFEALTKDIHPFVSPYLVVYDEATKTKVFMNDVIGSLPDQVDSILFLLGENKEWNEHLISHPVLQHIYGSKEVELLNNYIMIVPSLNKEKAYIANMENNQLDSIVISDSLIQTLLNRIGIHHIDVARVRNYYKRLNLPFRVGEFSYEICSDNQYFYADIDLLMIDIDSIKDEIAPKWYPFQIRYDPSKKTLDVFEFDWWRNPPIDDGKSREMMELEYRKMIGDSILISGADRISPINTTKIKLLIELKKNTEGVFTYFKTKHVFELTGLKDFDGEVMTKPNHGYPYEIVDSYLYFNNSPMIFNHKTSSFFDVRLLNPKISWIYDITVVRDRIKILVGEVYGGPLTLYTIHQQTKKIISRTPIAADFKNCQPRMNDRYICYLDLKGDVHILDIR